MRYRLWKRRSVALLASLLLSVWALPVQGVQIPASGLGGRILNEAGCYYGDPAACVMTQDQAAAFARVLREQYGSLSERYQNDYQSVQLDGMDLPFGCYAALFDTGRGSPALFFVGGAEFETPQEEDGAYSGFLVGILDFGIWQYAGGQAVQPGIEGMDWSVYPDYVIGGRGGGEPFYTRYSFTENGISLTEAGSASVGIGEEGPEYTVDGKVVDQRTYDAWINQWMPEAKSMCGFQYGGGVEGRYWGVYPVEQVLSALDAYADLPEETANPSAQTGGEGAIPGITSTAPPQTGTEDTPGAAVTQPVRTGGEETAAQAAGSTIPSWLPVALGVGGGAAVIGSACALMVMLKKLRN